MAAQSFESQEKRVRGPTQFLSDFVVRLYFDTSRGGENGHPQLLPYQTLPMAYCFALSYSPIAVPFSALF